MTRLLEYARLMRLDRPIGLWLLLWPALWALWISADGQPGERVFAIFVAGTFLMSVVPRRGRSRAARCRRPRRSGCSWCLPVLRCC